jgi:HAD superfamily hydrolase (TIGR01509 family)
MKLSKNIKAAIFDLDGLIIDSEHVWAEAIDDFLNKHKVKNREVDFDRRGMGLQEILQKYKKIFGLKGSLSELTDQLRQIFYKLSFKNKKLKLLPGVKNFLRKTKGLKVALATGGHDKNKAKEVLKFFEIASFFGEIVSSDDVETGKPEPEVYFFTAEKLSVKPEECIVFEDSVNGVISGKKAGMTVYAVNKNEPLRNELKKAGADAVFKTFSEINI